MTQYYEPEARELESRANQSNDPAEQHRLWAEAARIGTPVEIDEYGDEIWPNPNARAQKRLVTTADDIARVQAMISEFPGDYSDYETHCGKCGRALPCRHCTPPAPRTDDYGPFYRD